MAHTLSQLRELWALRDARYRTRKASLTKDEADAVRVYRRHEVERLLPANTQHAAILSILAWYPPSPR